MCLYNYVKYSAVGPGVSGELYFVACMHMPL